MSTTVKVVCVVSDDVGLVVPHSVWEAKLATTASESCSINFVIIKGANA